MIHTHHLENQKKNRLYFSLTGFFSISLIIAFYIGTSSFITNFFPDDLNLFKIHETLKTIILKGMISISSILLLFFIGKSKYHRYKHLILTNAPQHREAIKRMVALEFFFNAIHLVAILIFFPAINNYLPITVIFVGGLAIQILLIGSAIKWHFLNAEMIGASESKGVTVIGNITDSPDFKPSNK